MEALTYILRSRQLHNFVKALPAVVLADRVALLVSHMAVGSHKNADRISS
jgi:hypothetical protein